jgi:UDP-2,4-diacetamido-2,4,6-trideoxy-beta-L-altropyranose hydrolase
VINNADAAFSAAGDTVYELISAGVPTAAVAIANNQIPAMEHLAAHGAIVGLGSYPDPGIGDDVILDAWRGLTGATTREHLSDTGMRLVDGQGTPRIARLIAELVSGKA